MKKMRAGIIGCGTIFPMHAYPLQDSDIVTLAAVCDVKEERAKQKAKEFGCSCYTDYREMLEKEDLDTVHLCLPHYLHASVAMDALKAGKHVLTEKPMAISHADAVKMVETAKACGKTLGVILQNRYNPGSVLIKEACTAGKLGKVLGAKLSVTWYRDRDYYAKSDWRGRWATEGGGVLINQAVHTFDLMRWFVDEDIDYVEANLSNRVHDEMEVEDTAEGIISFKSGVKGLFYATNAYAYSAPVELELYCEKGKAKMEMNSATITYKDGTVETADPEKEECFGYGAKAQGYWGVSHVKQIRSFYRSLAENKPLAITAEDALATQRMMYEIYNAGKLRKRVYLK